MAEIDIYTTPLCPYCSRAKRLLKSKNVTFNEINIWISRNKREEMLERTGGRYTVPQIFIDSESVGGCDELYALEARGRLDEMLATQVPI